MELRASKVVDELSTLGAAQLINRSNFHQHALKANEIRPILALKLLALVLDGEFEFASK
jgi:hypothetical protein